jgi:hypothetical protein
VIEGTLVLSNLSAMMIIRFESRRRYTKSYGGARRTPIWTKRLAMKTKSYSVYAFEGRS